jgi:hypothetical protein
MGKKTRQKGLWWEKEVGGKIEGDIVGKSD